MNIHHVYDVAGPYVTRVIKMGGKQFYLYGEKHDAIDSPNRIMDINKFIMKSKNMTNERINAFLELPPGSFRLAQGAHFLNKIRETLLPKKHKHLTWFM